MTVELPKFHECMTPVLEVLKQHGQLHRSDATDLVIERMGLSPEQIALIHESNGSSIIRGRIGWASWYLKTCVALHKPQRAHWALGPNADALLALGRKATVSDVKKFPEWQEYEQSKLESTVEEIIDTAEDTKDFTPEDLIEKGFSALKNDLAAKLLETLKSVKPEKFEAITLKAHHYLLFQA